MCEKKKGVKDTDLFEEPDDILADLSQANDDIVDVDVIKSGVISTFSSSLVQNQIPAVYWREKVLFFPRRTEKGIIMLNNVISWLACFLFCFVFCISSLPAEMFDSFSLYISSRSPIIVRLSGKIHNACKIFSYSEHITFVYSCHFLKN